MSWSAITSNEVLDELNTAEAAAVNSLTTNSLAAILSRVVNAARDAVVAGGGRVDAAGTIPDQLREDVIAIARWKWLLSLPKDEAIQSETRKAAHDEAQKRLDMVAAGKLKIAVPDNPIATTAPANAVTVPRKGADVDPRGFGRMGSS